MKKMFLVGVLFLSGCTTFKTIHDANVLVPILQEATDQANSAKKTHSVVSMSVTSSDLKVKGVTSSLELMGWQTDDKVLGNGERIFFYDGTK